MISIKMASLVRQDAILTYNGSNIDIRIGDYVRITSSDDFSLYIVSGINGRTIAVQPDVDISTQHIIHINIGDLQFMSRRLTYSDGMVILSNDEVWNRGHRYYVLGFNNSYVRIMRRGEDGQNDIDVVDVQPGDIRMTSNYKMYVRNSGVTYAYQPNSESEDEYNHENESQDDYEDDSEDEYEYQTPDRPTNPHGRNSVRDERRDRRTLTYGRRVRQRTETAGGGSAISGTYAPSTSETYATSETYEQQHERKKKDKITAQIAKIKKIRIRRKEGLEKSKPKDDVCVICREDMFDDLSNTLRLPCGHVFHIECILLSYASSGEYANRCPECRAVFNETDLFNSDPIVKEVDENGNEIYKFKF